jgi:ABC-type siderophore export system fused ATPase/permease subunit
MIMVTHSREVVGLADRLLTVREGRLVEIAPESLT